MPTARLCPGQDPERIAHTGDRQGRADLLQQEIVAERYEKVSVILNYCVRSAGRRFFPYFWHGAAKTLGGLFCAYCYNIRNILRLQFLSLRVFEKFIRSS